MADSKLSVEGLHLLLIFTDVNDKCMSCHTECKAVGVGCAFGLSLCHKDYKDPVLLPWKRYLVTFPFQTLLMVSVYKVSVLLYNKKLYFGSSNFE